MGHNSQRHYPRHRHRHRHNHHHHDEPDPAHLIRLKSISLGEQLLSNNNNKKLKQQHLKRVHSNFMAGNYLPSAISIEKTVRTV